VVRFAMFSAKMEVLSQLLVIGLIFLSDALGRDF